MIVWLREPRLIRTRWLILCYIATFIVIAVAEVVGYEASKAGLFTLPQSELQTLEKLAQNPSYMAIFIHNLVLNLAINIPFAGPILYLVFMGTTGLALGFIVYEKLSSMLGGALGLTMGFASTALFPHGLVELLAYSLSLYNSLAFTLWIIRGRHVRDAALHWLARLALSILVLFAAAVIEYVELTYLKGLLNMG